MVQICNRLLLVLALLVVFNVEALTVDHTKILNQQKARAGFSTGFKKSTVMSDVAFIHLSKDKQKKLSSIFNLKPKQYRQFLYYMNDTMDGYEYDQAINPNLVLAMHTKDPILYQRYLENVAQADHDALARLLKVTVDYPRIMKQLYPNERPMMTSAMRANINNKLQKGDVVQLFCHPHSAVCSNILGIIKDQIVNSDGARLDLFFVGKIKRAEIISFARNNNISANSVMNHHITLNFGNDSFAALERESHHHLPLPYLLVRRGGKSIPVDLVGHHA